MLVRSPSLGEDHTQEPSSYEVNARSSFFEDHTQEPPSYNASMQLGTAITKETTIQIDRDMNCPDINRPEIWSRWFKRNLPLPFATMLLIAFGYITIIWIIIAPMKIPLEQYATVSNKDNITNSACT